MKTMVKVSIIIPHYNSIESLEKLLLSIPKIDEIEIIVVDDRSNNNLEKHSALMKSNMFSHVIFMDNNTNKKGAGVCRNIGFKRAKGEWVLFADADDILLDNFYETVKQYFKTNNDVIFFTPTSIESQTGDISDRHETYEKIIVNYIQKNDYEAKLFLRYRFLVPWSKLIRTNFLKKNRIYFDEVIASNDVMFSTKVGYYMKKFEVSNKVIYCVTRNIGSLTVNISENVFDARLMVHISYCNFLRSNLNSKELKYFDIKGSGYILSVIKYRLGLKKILSTYSLLHQEKIKIFDFKFFNPVYTIKKIVYHYRIYKKNKKYFVRN
jgi:glycosyltransferase involved in cell wall biosynthesis